MLMYDEALILANFLAIIVSIKKFSYMIKRKQWLIDKKSRAFQSFQTQKENEIVFKAQKYLRNNK